MTASTLDLTTSYLGLTLPSPIVPSAGPLTGELPKLEEMAAAGAGAVVLPSLFEEQIEYEAALIEQELGFDDAPDAEFVNGHFPRVSGYNRGPDQYLALLEEAADVLPIPVIASLNGTTRGGWTSFATLLEHAGAAAIELNVYQVAADPAVSGADVEDRIVRLVSDVRSSVDVPLAVKLGSQFSSVPHLARRLVDAGADGLVLFNRFYQPEIDLDQLDVIPHVHLSSSEELGLVVRWLAILRSQLSVSMAATTGIHTGDDAVKALLVGADVVMMTSALLHHGPRHVRTVIDEMTQWFDERDYESVAEGRGSLSQGSVPNPTAYERANYAKTLSSYQARPRPVR